MRLWILLGSLLLMSAPLSAEEVALDVVRKGANLYEVTAEDLFIQTEYCFEVEEQARVLLSLDENNQRLIFQEGAAQCDVTLVYGRSSLAAGKYKLSVTRQDENWYTLDDEEAALKTSGCLSLVEQADARLEMKEDGTGVLQLPSVEETCNVEGVYAKTELSIVEK